MTFQKFESPPFADVDELGLPPEPEEADNSKQVLTLVSEIKQTAKILAGFCAYLTIGLFILTLISESLHNALWVLGFTGAFLGTLVAFLFFQQRIFAPLIILFIQITGAIVLLYQFMNGTLQYSIATFVFDVAFIFFTSKAVFQTLMLRKLRSPAR